MSVWICPCVGLSHTYTMLVWICLCVWQSHTYNVSMNLSLCTTITHTYNVGMNLSLCMTYMPSEVSFKELHQITGHVWHTRVQGGHKAWVEWQQVIPVLQIVTQFNQYRMLHVIQQNQFIYWLGMHQKGNGSKSHLGYCTQLKHSRLTNPIFH